VTDKHPGLDRAYWKTFTDSDLAQRLEFSLEQARHFETKAAWWRADCAATYYEIQKRKAAKS